MLGLQGAPAPSRWAQGVPALGEGQTLHVWGSGAHGEAARRAGNPSSLSQAPPPASRRRWHLAAAGDAGSRMPAQPLRRRRPAPLQLLVRAVASTEAASATTGQPYGRVFNFSAGPAQLPVEVLEQAQADLLNWRGSGMSVMEMSHRGKEFQSIIDAAEADLRALLGIPDTYTVLFMQVHTVLCSLACWWGAAGWCGVQDGVAAGPGCCTRRRRMPRHAPSTAATLTHPRHAPPTATHPPPHPHSHLQGGASTQFSAIPLNLAGEGEAVDYVVTGSWSKKAAGGVWRRGAAGAGLSAGGAGRRHSAAVSAPASGSPSPLSHPSPPSPSLPHHHSPHLHLPQRPKSTRPSTLWRPATTSRCPRATAGT